MFEKYYYGISFPKIHTWIPSKHLREDKSGNFFAEIKGRFNEKKALMEFLFLVQQAGIPITKSCYVPKNITKSRFKEIIENCIKYHKDFKNDPEDNPFNKKFTPTFKRVDVEPEDNLQSHFHIQSESFTTLVDYKIMKLLVPVLSHYCLNSEVQLIQDEYGWKFDIIEKPNIRAIPLKSIFRSNLLPVDIDWIDYYIKDDTFFSYYNIKSGLLESVINMNEKTLNEINYFYNTYLRKDWKTV